MTQPIGVLALQGDYAAHKALLHSLGAEAVEIRRPKQLSDVRGLVIPGGESTTLLKLMDFEPEWWTALPDFVQRGGGVFGTCAGLILLARSVTGPEQRSLGLLDVRVERNAYGRQIDSFIAPGEWIDGRELPMVFIRAPKIIALNESVETLAMFESDPVLVRQNKVIAGSFHPEINSEPSVHKYFLDLLNEQ